MNPVARALRAFRLIRWLGEDDSNVDGVAGEIIAEHFLGMKKAPRQTRPQGQALLLA